MGHLKWLSEYALVRVTLVNILCGAGTIFYCRKYYPSPSLPVSPLMLLAQGPTESISQYLQLYRTLGICAIVCLTLLFFSSNGQRKCKDCVPTWHELVSNGRHAKISLSCE